MGRLISSAEAAKRLGVTQIRVQVLCRTRRIPGARLIGRSWMLPENFEVKPGSRGPKRELSDGEIDFKVGFATDRGAGEQLYAMSSRKLTAQVKDNDTYAEQAANVAIGNRCAAKRRHAVAQVLEAARAQAQVARARHEEAVALRIERALQQRPDGEKLLAKAVRMRTGLDQVVEPGACEPAALASRK